MKIKGERGLWHVTSFNTTEFTVEFRAQLGENLILEIFCSSLGGELGGVSGGRTALPESQLWYLSRGVAARP